jgi:hypothetical protein
VLFTEPDGVGDPVGLTLVDVGAPGLVDVAPLPPVVVVETPAESYDQTLRRFEPPQVSSELPWHGMLQPLFPSGAGPPPFWAELPQ